MGRGDSEKLNPGLGAKRYGFEEQRKYLFGLWEELRLGSDVVLVLQDTGSMFGFDWANQNRKRVRVRPSEQAAEKLQIQFQQEDTFAGLSARAPSLA
jgi:hypothetical protein